MTKLSDYHTHILNKEIERRLVAYDKLNAFVLDFANANLTPNTAFSIANRFRTYAKQLVNID